MSVQVRTGGTWRTAGSGALNIRNGGSWRSANACYVKIGGVGAGYWYDSGYRGYPAVPSTPWVTGWDYSNVNVGWSAGGGGAPVAYYQLEHNHPGGIQGIDNYGGGQSNNYGVNWDSTYSFRVRAVSTGGLVSGWSPYRYVAIGHPQQDTYGYVQRTRGWQTEHQWNYRFMYQAFNWQIPPSIALNAIHATNIRCGPPGNQGSSIVQRTSSRRLVSLQTDAGWAGSLFGHNGDVASGTSFDRSLAGNWGGNNWWGIYPTGNNGEQDNNTGWSTGANVALSLYCDDVWIDGTEYYDNWELTNRIYEQGNVQYT